MKVDEFKYPGSSMQSEERYIKVSKALSWKATHGMNKIWTSRLSKGSKARLFRAAITTIAVWVNLSIGAKQ